MGRVDGRAPSQGRKVNIITDFVSSADGSCLIEVGRTRVICTASVEESVPPFLRGKGQGWVTAEYAMLPASTGTRKKRDGLSKDGRSVEIQRLIGRSLRQAVDLQKLGERTITLDCDVLEADGGTRTASITGAMVALTCAVDKLIEGRKLLVSPLHHQVAAISCGIVQGEPALDLCYEEDSAAQVDMNVVMNEQGEFIELQGTGEGQAFSPDELNQLITLAKAGINRLMEAQRQALGDRARRVCPNPTLVVATGNPNKLREIETIFGDLYSVASMQAMGFAGAVEENAATFAGNAILKAEEICAATGLATLADDSGLTVEALDGEPGVYSARYAGVHGDDQANNDLLLRRMRGKTARSAAFVCALALARPGKETIVTEGTCPGVILEEPRGEGGFGYDPLFLYEPLNKTFAELTEEEKNTISHRALASAQMLEIMKGLED